MAVTGRAMGPESSAAEKRGDLGFSSRRHTQEGKKRKLSRNKTRSGFSSQRKRSTTPQAMEMSRKIRLGRVHRVVNMRSQEFREGTMNKLPGVEVSPWHRGKSESRLHCLETWVREKTECQGEVGLKAEGILGCGFSVVQLKVTGQSRTDHNLKPKGNPLTGGIWGDG